ncbi:hypothetical protein [Streptomyces antnestii]|uniref:hypothetical protein n=1 Tax=Streptomyces antnestii TaxID=2494256 RepID=UPI001672F00A|nr:hypothetical protein [Streptomyces sp. San01]
MADFGLGRAPAARLIENGRPINRGQVAQILKTASGGGARGQPDQGTVIMGR